MRISAALVILVTSVPAIAAGPVQAPGATQAANCPRTTSYLANQTGLYRGPPPTVKKLTELPKGTAYMAVYRRIGGCEVPLTMVDYRNARRR